MYIGVEGINASVILLLTIKIEFSMHSACTRTHVCTYALMHMDMLNFVSLTLKSFFYIILSLNFSFVTINDHSMVKLMQLVIAVAFTITKIIYNLIVPKSCELPVVKTRHLRCSIDL